MSRLTIPKHLFVIAMAVMLTVMSACAKHVDQSEIAGTYEAHHQNGSEILQLRSNGLYVHEFKAANGVVSTNSNRWRFEPFNDESKVALYNFTSHFPVSSKRGDIVLLDAAKDWRRVRLYISYDLDQYYKKVSDE